MTDKLDKPFKTYNQQMKILRTRNLEVKSKNKRSLERSGYYALINGYKWPFLQRDSRGKVIHPERYINHSNFDEIKTLYEFDFDLRSILYRALLKYEIVLKSEISYRFSERYPEEHSYLAIDNYNRNSKKVKTVVETISQLSSTLSNYSSKPSAIKHYVNNHNHVPLWVLSNYLTFGNLNYFYQVLTNEVRLNIAKDFKKMYEHDYNVKTPSLDPSLIDSINKIVNFFRNSVAHGNITYSLVVEHSAKINPIINRLQINNIYSPKSQAGVFDLIVCLKVFIQKKEYKRLKRDILELIEDYKVKFNSISFDVILQDMRFPTNYKTILKQL